MTPLTNKIKKHRLTLSFLLIILLFLSFGIFTTNGLYALGNLTKTIYKHPLVVSNAALKAALNITKMHRSMKDAVLSNSPNEIAASLNSVADAEMIVYQQLDIIREDILGDDGKALEKQTRQFFVNWKPIRDEVIRLYNLGEKKDAILITKAKGAEHVAKLEAKMMELTSYARRKATGFINFAKTSQARLEKITFILTFIGIFLSVIIAFIATYRVMKTEKLLVDEKNKLQDALNEIKTLRGIIPICSYCKQIRDDEGIWMQIERYFHEHSEADLSHGICPDCLRKHFPEVAASMSPEKKQVK